jgi:acetyltransferase-like isoleucine patch superfamily enzyme
MRRPSALASAVFLGLYRFAIQARGKIFSVLSANSFDSFGAGSIIQPPVRLAGEDRVAIGSDVFIGPNCWLQVLEGGDGIALTIGDGTQIAGHCVLAAAASVRLGRSVLLARNVYISDHSHAFEDPPRPILAQGITHLEPVEIGDGAWLGENVFVCPGVRIGRGAVIGANSVVREDIPAYSVAVGAPARVTRQFASTVTTVA